MFLDWKSPGPPVKPTFEGAIAFWAGKDPLESYTWENPAICACGQYSKSIGDTTWLHDNSEFWGALNMLASFNPRTFGALTERAKKRIDRQRQTALCG